jgi:hypothetical protein
MGWEMPWDSAPRDSLEPLLVGRRRGRMHIVRYLRQGSKVFETYWTTSRGAEVIDNNYHLLDLTFYGRQENWEDSPAGWPQHYTYTRTGCGSPSWQPEWPGGAPSPNGRARADPRANLAAVLRELENDVKIAFKFCKAALSRPLPAGTSVVLISSGAALAGSPLSGGYAGAKSTQIFIANYSQKESDRLGLGLRFMAIAPHIVPDTDFGKHAVAGYSRYLGISATDFVQSMVAPPTACIVATAVIELVLNPYRSLGDVFIVAGKGLEAVAA